LARFKETPSHGGSGALSGGLTDRCEALMALAGQRAIGLETDHLRICTWLVLDCDRLTHAWRG
jgi:hypothetical protein